MEKVFGIDLGTNSIGWALREINPELENQLIDKGVLTFEKGVAEEKGNEVPKVKNRTTSRGTRRNYQARRYRKWRLLKLLIEENMCPLTIEELNEWRHYKKGIGRKYPLKNEFINWLRFDFDGNGVPDFERFGFSKHESFYLFRKLIIDETKVEIFKLEPQIIGRVLYQLVQRRGYNDGEDIDENEREELSNTIMNGGGDSGALGVNNIKDYIIKYKTLGAALYEIQKEKNVRIRKRYNLRSDYKKEIEEICRVQNLQHLQKNIMSAIIWQRPLRSQKGLVGICTYEKNKRRCPISHPLYEEYRTWVFINNLKIKPIIKNDIPINKISIEDCLTTIVYPQFFKAADFKLSSIKTALARVGFQITAKFPNDTKVSNLSFLYRIKDVFGEDWEIKTGWFNILNGITKNVQYNIEDLWHIHFNKTDNKHTGESAINFIKRFAKEKLLLDDIQVDSFSKIKLKQGYATLSINAIKKILPYLQKGFIYSEAIYLANLSKVMGAKFKQEDIENYDRILKEIFKQDKEDKKKAEIYNKLITLYFEDKEQFVQNKIAIIEQQLKDSFGKITWEKFSAEKQSIIENNIFNDINSFLAQPKQKIEQHFIKTKRLHDKIFNKLMDEFGLPSENIKYLWHPSEQDTYENAKYFQEINFNNKKYYIEENKVDTFLKKNQSAEKEAFFGKLLGSPIPISKGFKNPMALKTLYYLKNLINYLIKTGKIDTETRVVVEIARELNDANKRKAIELFQKERDNENNNYKKKIEEINQECNTTFDVNDKVLINKIRLWVEQKQQCLYTGKTIKLCDVLDGSKYDIEHTIPVSISFDSELKNLTIADKTYNQQIKIKKLPTECPNYSDDALGFSAILPRLDFIKDKVEHYEDAYDKCKYFAKVAQTKEQKDLNIIKKHIAKMHLEYWQYKLFSFTTNEYKVSWRNSQLRDTQIITKYALHYLKTIFEKVEVQKGIITDEFRRIYKIQNRLEKKDRTKHSHHAIDAAVLTLIPPASIREEILKKYNEAKENNISYHETPRKWHQFQESFIRSIEDEILINFQAEHRTLTPTYKVVRKRGKVQKYIDKDGVKKNIIAKGDTIRGRLHKQSFYGIIKNGDDLNVVERCPISTFLSINDCKHIVDDKIKVIVKSELEKRVAAGTSFEKAKLLPIYFPNSNTIINKVRCKVAAGRGNLTPDKSIPIKMHTFKSKQDYKQFKYAQNDENTLCLYYELNHENKIKRAFKIVGLFELSKLGLKNISAIKQIPAYANIETGRGINKIQLPMVEILMVGTRVIYYKEHLEELKELTLKELSRRTYVIYKFNDVASTKYIYLQSHIEARVDKELGDGETEINIDKYQSRLKLTSEKFYFAIENNHFKLMPDGKIIWNF